MTPFDVAPPEVLETEALDTSFGRNTPFGDRGGLGALFEAEFFDVGDKVRSMAPGGVFRCVLSHVFLSCEEVAVEELAVFFWSSTFNSSNFGERVSVDMNERARAGV